jgi:hypothetical protein
VPEGIPCERGWRCLRVAAAMPFSVVGVIASLTAPLAEAGISVFAVSTFDTDYLLVKEKDLKKAIDVLRRQGHTVQSGTERVLGAKGFPPHGSFPRQRRADCP